MKRAGARLGMVLRKRAWLVMVREVQALQYTQLCVPTGSSVLDATYGLCVPSSGSS